MAYGTRNEAGVLSAYALSRRRLMAIGAAGAVIAASPLRSGAARAQARVIPNP